jgi:hypothetical protein
MQLGKDPGASKFELFTQLNHAYHGSNVHVSTKLHADWHLNWFKLKSSQHN